MSSRRGRASWTGDNRDDLVDGLFGSMRDKAQHDLGREVSIASDAEALLVGLPLPALCLRYLFQSTTFPLSRITQITGEEGSAKSAFLFEVMRWHMVYGGGGFLAENENKDSPELKNAIMGWNPTWLRRLQTTETHSLEEWQDAITTFVEIARQQQDRTDGPGRTVPIMFAVDSLMATAPQSEIDAVNKDGHASRGYALAANLIARYMRTMPERIQKYPFSIVGTNHLKPATDYMGRPTSNIPGGKAVKFMETFEVEMHRAQNTDIDRLEYGGLRVKMVARKNSLGPSRKQIQAELLWWWADVGGVWRQQTAWDWDTATIELLLSFENAKGKKTIYNRLMEICDINVVSKTQRLVWSNALGIPRDQPQLYRVAGALLEGRQDLLTPIYQTLSITARRPFQPGVDYRDLLATAREQASAQVADLYADVGGLPMMAAAEGGDEIDVEDGDAPSSEERSGDE